jgi:hypothetical protein
VTNINVNRPRTGLGLQQSTGAWANGFAYDNARRFTKVFSPPGELDYLYPASLPSTLVMKISLPNSSWITNTFDDAARLLATKLLDSGLSTLDSASYGYNVGNQRTSYTDVLIGSVVKRRP